MVMFIDDILIYFKFDEEHVKHIRVVLQTLKEKKLYVKLSKCEFWLKDVIFLGHVISSGGIAVDPLKIDVLLQWETPKFVTEIRSFMHLTGYYMRFIEGFSKLTLPLTHLTHKVQAYVWDVHYEESFQELKRKLMSAPVLIISNQMSPFFCVLRCFKDGSRWCVNAE